MRLFGLVIFLFIPFLTFAQGNAIVLNNNTMEVFSNKIRGTEDKGFEINNVLSGQYDAVFRAYDSLKVPQGKSSYWLKFVLKNSEATAKEYIIGTNYFDYVTVYYRAADGSLRTAESGNWFPMTKKDFGFDADSYLSVLLEPNVETVIYVHARNEKAPYFRSIAFNWTVFSQSAFANKRLFKSVFIYLFIGAAGIMFFYNLALLLLIRQNIYFSYILYNLLATFFTVTTSGEWFAWFEQDARHYEDYQVFLGTIMVLSLMYFCHELLQLQKNMPKLSRLFYLAMIAGALTLPLHYFELYGVHFVVARLLAVFNLFLIFWAIIASIRKGNKLAFYFSIGFTFYFFSAIAFVGQTSGALPYDLFAPLIPINISEIANALKLSLFSLTLGYKINLMQDELKQKELEQIRIRQEEEAKRAQLIEEKNRELEQKVVTRTAELVEKNEEIQQQHEELKLTSDKLIEQHNLIEDLYADMQASITYALRIQEAILPNKDMLGRCFADYFIFYRPRDIVSGDFYWATEIWTRGVKKQIFVVADCTGHGVPGAFMSLICANLLNQTVTERKIYESDAILRELDLTLRRFLNKDTNDNHDGMDCAVVVIDRRNKVMDFTGAKRPLIYFQDEKLFEIKGDAKSIGGHEREKASFTKNSVNFDENTVFYLYTDGYADQIGGENKRKFMTRNLRNLFSEMKSKPMSEQGEHLKNTFEKWQGKEQQIDDVLVVGFRL
jgi:serine phosphatase RsbU (regulator of sigma subunit)